jgi:hypothetical protein
MGRRLPDAGGGAEGRTAVSGAQAGGIQPLLCQPAHQLGVVHEHVDLRGRFVDRGGTCELREVDGIAALPALSTLEMCHLARILAIPDPGPGSPQARVSPAGAARSAWNTTARSQPRICAANGPAGGRGRLTTSRPARRDRDARPDAFALPAACPVRAQKKAWMPVIARPRMSAWMSCVPS